MGNWKTKMNLGSPTRNNGPPNQRIANLFTREFLMVGISFTAGVLFLVQPWPTVGFKVVQSWWWVLGSCGLSLAFSKDEPTSKHGKSSELWLTTLKRMKLCCNLFLHAWILLLFQRNPSIGRIKGYKQIFIPTRKSQGKTTRSRTTTHGEEESNISHTGTK